MQLGLLVNFGLQKVEVERIPFTEKQRAIDENFDYIKNYIGALNRNLLAKIRDSILYVFEAHGLGYGESTYRSVVEAELDFREIKHQNRSPIELTNEGEKLSVFMMKPLLIEDRIIFDIRALEEKIDFYDIAKIQSYLKALNLKIGLIANFGKTELEIRGIRA